MVTVLAPHTVFEASFYTEISALQIYPLLNPAVLHNISPSPFDVPLVICDEPIEVMFPSSLSVYVIS